MNETSSHETVFELLPWYVNDTLGDGERELVEAHVHTCLTCRLELKKEYQLEEFLRTAPTVDLSPEAGFARLARTLETPTHARRRPFGQRVWSGWVDLSTEARFALATFTLVAAAVLVWGAMTPTEVLEQPGYVTLTGSPTASNHVDVIFADHVTEAQMRTLLTEINASIIAGPTEIGRYTVRLEDPAVDDERLMAFISGLSADDRIRFVGPSSVGASVE